jgi:hypothetical protein
VKRVVPSQHIAALPLPGGPLLPRKFFPLTSKVIEASDEPGRGPHSTTPLQSTRFDSHTKIGFRERSIG